MHRQNWQGLALVGRRYAQAAKEGFEREAAQRLYLGTLTYICTVKANLGQEPSNSSRLCCSPVII